MWRFDVLLIVLVVLKFEGLIDWSWWLVLAPFYVPFAFTFTLRIIQRVSKSKDDDLSA